MNNSEWVTGNTDDFASKKPFLKSFYKSKANLFEVNNKDLFLAINPVLQLQMGKETDYGERLFLNSRGEYRGRIAGKVGFSSTITDNQERGPLFSSNRCRDFVQCRVLDFTRYLRKISVHRIILMQEDTSHLMLLNSLTFSSDMIKILSEMVTVVYFSVTGETVTCLQRSIQGYGNSITRTYSWS